MTTYNKYQENSAHDKEVDEVTTLSTESFEKVESLLDKPLHEVTPAMEELFQVAGFEAGQEIK
jgi:hypothetical protein